MLDTILEKFGDHGSESSRRDDFQKHYAIQWCIDAIIDKNISEVICEYGEDLVINRSGYYELYQVKTKQESVKDWQLNELLPIMAKTLAIMPYFPKVHKCCFVSNEGADGKLYKLKCVFNKGGCIWDAEDTRLFEEFCNYHGEKLLQYMHKWDNSNSDTNSSLKEKLKLFNIYTNYHHMDYIRDTNLKRLREILDKSSNGMFIYNEDEVESVYDDLMGLVGLATIGKTRQEKTINKMDIHKCLNKTVNRKILYRYPKSEEIDKLVGETKLEKKLIMGGFTPPFIDDARENMMNVKLITRENDFDSFNAVLEDISIRVKHIWADSYDKESIANRQKDQIGREILEDVKKELPKLNEHYQQTNYKFVDEYFLKGIMWDLTSQCKVYWSKKNI